MPVGAHSKVRRPVGVFDSGLGGLTVVSEMLEMMPTEQFIYIGDSGHAPYGAQSEESIRQFSEEISRFLVEQYHCRGLVIACNTATAAAADRLRSIFPLPIIGMEPAVKPATQVTKTGRVGILATVGMLSSARFAALLTRYEGDVEFLTQPCPGLPEAVEEGKLSAPETRSLVEKYVTPLIKQGVDTLVLGCTHYPVLRPLISEIAGPDIALIDTGKAVARRAADVLEGDTSHPEPLPAPDILLFTTGDSDLFARGAGIILKQSRPPCVTRLYWNKGELTRNGTS